MSRSALLRVVLGVGYRQLDQEQLARALYAEHAGALLSYVQRLVRGDRQLAEDIVQETLVRAWRHADRVTPEAGRPWLFTTARHLVVDTYRARAVRPAETAAELAEPAVTEDGIDAVLDATLVSDALRSLSRAHREVLVACYFRGLSAQQLATELGLPAGTVRSRLYYGLRALRLALQERGVSGL